jgi:ribosomal protein S18 acetylase RimI-like enzyme
MVNIRKYLKSDLQTVLEITDRAWTQVFPLMREDIPKYVYDSFYPEGWKKRQLKEVENTCTDAQTDMWVAEDDARIVGYLGLRSHVEDSMGEIYIIAVDPNVQQRGIGRALMSFAFNWMKAKGLKMAFVETGGDRGHAPARLSYEAVGFERYHVARYFKEL